MGLRDELLFASLADSGAKGAILRACALTAHLLQVSITLTAQETQQRAPATFSK